MQVKTKKVNIAPSSDEGHYIVDAKQVINLDEINETFLVKGKSKMVTKNHTSLDISEDCLITCQKEFNPLSRIYEKVKD